MRTLVICLLLLCSSSFADTVIRIVDTGPGLATVTRFDNGEVMVYDTGHWYHDDQVAAEIESFIGDDGDTIALLVASVTDSDHIGATDELFNNYHVERVLRTGFERDSSAWRAHDEAINAAEAAGRTHDINLAEVKLQHGTQYNFGSAKVTFLSGFHRPPSVWGLSGKEYRNANSIVIRVDYKGNSVLFTGDAVGRQSGVGSDSAPADAKAIATERYLIDNSGARPIAADILIAPQHGGDESSSQEFIKAVAPRWVVFSAGHAQGFPKDLTAQRYTSLGFQEKCLLRTDIGDNESNKGEWKFGVKRSHVAKAGENSIEITLPESGEPTVKYLGQPAVSCPEVITANRRMLSKKDVKKTKSGLCHIPGSAWYSATDKFDSFDTLAGCLASGGRIP